jgi:hypothetical protein
MEDHDYTPMNAKLEARISKPETHLIRSFVFRILALGFFACASVAQTNLNSIQLTGWLIATNSGPPPSVSAGTNLTGYFVDYASGSDSNPGTNSAAPWQHLPQDPAATSNALAHATAPGDTFWLKGGVNYVVTGDGEVPYQAGILLNQSGTNGAPISYASSTNWGINTNRAIVTDNYHTNGYPISAFYIYGNVSNLVFNNLEICNMGGSSNLPPDTGRAVMARNGYGIWVNSGTLRDSLVENCYFHNLGYWYNQKPMDANSVGIDPTNNLASSCAINLYNAIGVTVTNCEITRVHTGINLNYFTLSTNVTLTANYIHDYITWLINVAGPNTGSGGPYVLDYLTISHNLFSGVSWAYAPDYWTGYGAAPHQDGIFHVTNGSGVVSNGPHINICFNTFRTTHPNEINSAMVYLETAPSANIYNNLFDTPNLGDPSGSGHDINISIETNAPCSIHILNNTFVINNTNSPGGNSYSQSIAWGCGGGNLLPTNYWPASALLDVRNNLTYDFYNGGNQDIMLLIGVVTNSVATNSWTVDYNDWRTLSTAPEQWAWWHNGYSEPSIPDVAGGLSLLRTNWGMEVHGMISDPAFASLAYGCTTNSSGNNYALQSGSACISNGVNLSSLNLPGLTNSLNGVARPASGPWTIGAYQY